jgi:hypothetical protein
VKRKWSVSKKHFKKLSKSITFPWRALAPTGFAYLKRRLARLSSVRSYERDTLTRVCINSRRKKSKIFSQCFIITELTCPVLNICIIRNHRIPLAIVTATSKPHFLFTSILQRMARIYHAQNIPLYSLLWALYNGILNIIITMLGREGRDFFSFFFSHFETTGQMDLATYRVVFHYPYCRTTTLTTNP